MLKISHSIENLNTGHTEVKQTEPYIIFTVNNEEFGVEASKVLELVNYLAPLKMPNNYGNVQGMASYRGKIIPIIDLRMIFGLNLIHYDDNAVTIVVESNCAFGVTAEQVLDLVFIPLNSIKKVSAFNFGERTKYLKSVANFGERLVLLLDLEKLVETETAQPILKEPDPLECSTKVEALSGYYETKLESSSVPGNILAVEQDANLTNGESTENGLVKVTRELIEIGSIEKTSPKLSEISQVSQSSRDDYLIDPKELEDLLKGIPQLGQEEEARLSDEVIEDLLKELEAKSQSGSNGPLSDGDLPNLKADQFKGPKEKWDV